MACSLCTLCTVLAVYGVFLYLLQGGYTALHMVAFDDNTQVVELLLAHNSDPNHQASVSCRLIKEYSNTAKSVPLC